MVSHSANLAAGVAELAREMGGAEVTVEPAGGLGAEAGAVGTDAQLVAAAIERAWSDDGVLVLMDLGSAVLSAEMALEFLAPERCDRVVLCPAPLVEGAVAAAAVARTGATLDEVVGEALGGLTPKAAHLGIPVPAVAPPETELPGGKGLEVRLVIKNRLGLHARPAARFVQTARSFDAETSATNLTTGRGPGSGRSLNGLATLGVRQGHEVLVRARGPQAAQALEAIQALADRDFDDAAAPEPVAAPAPASSIGVPGAPVAGLAASPGIAVGPARHFRVPDLEVPDRPAPDAGEERQALRAALARVREETREARERVAVRAGEYEAAILDAHLLFLEDEALLEPTHRAIDEGRTAARAWADATGAVVDRYRALDDEYLRARAEDLAGVARRVLEHLVGGEDLRPGMSGPGILITETLTPTDAAALDPRLVHGIGTAAGGPTSHSAILARSMGIPAVVALGPAALDVREEATLILDGDAGLLWVDPEPEVLREHVARREALEAAAGAARKAAAGPAVTRDGHRVEVAANAGSQRDVEEAVAAGAEGIGLLRTEFLFLDRTTLPGEEEQHAAYRRIAGALGGLPLIIRTLDAGADKPLPALPTPPEPNPFLGVRGIRLALAHPEVLRTQLRAVLRTAAGHPVRVMFPMVATADEFRAARALVAECRAELAAEGIPVPEDLDTGVMVEVPSAALEASVLASEVGFFSVGTNDLAQYVLAADRGNEAVAGLADAFHPAVLRLIREVVEAAEMHGRWVGVCGEVAGDLQAVPILLGLGVTELSVSPPLVPAVKQAVREVDLGKAEAVAQEALSQGSAAAVRAFAARAAEGVR